MNNFTNKHWFGLAMGAVAFLLLVGRVASGQTVTGDREPTYLSGYLTCGINEDGSRTCPFRLHYVNLEKNHTYMIRMESSDFDTVLTLEDEFGKALMADADYYDALYGIIVFRPAETGRYRLVANALTPREGFYSITIRDLPMLLNVKDALDKYDLPVNDCFERAFDVALTAGRRYIIDMDSADFDAYVKLRNSDGTVVAFEDECGALRNARIVFEPSVSGTYRVIATSFAERATGAFRLTVCEE